MKNTDIYLECPECGEPGLYADEDGKFHEDEESICDCDVIVRIESSDGMAYLVERA